MLITLICICKGISLVRISLNLICVDRAFKVVRQVEAKWGLEFSILHLICIYVDVNLVNTHCERLFLRRDCLLSR